MKTFLFLIAFLPLGILAQKKLTNENSVDLIKKGIELFDKESYEEAITLFSKVNINDTNYAAAQYETALSHINLEKYVIAQDILKDLLDYPIKYDFKQKVYMQLGNAYDLNKQHEEALAIYTEGLKFYPHQHNLLYNRGVCYESLKDFDKAMADYQAAILGNIYHSNSHLRLGIVAANNDLYEQALLSLMTFLWLSPNDSRSPGVVQVINKLSDGTYEKTEMPLKDPKSYDNYTEYNELFVNRIALQNNYKTKFTIGVNYAKQLHLFLKNNQYDENNPDFWNQLYMRFYSQIWKVKQIDNLILTSLLSIDKEQIQSKINSKKSSIKSFYEEAKTMYNLANKTHYMEFEGKRQKVNLNYNSAKGYSEIGVLAADGQTPVGNFYYYHENGLLKMIAHFDDKGNPIGKWEVWDNFDGVLERTIEFLGNDKRLNTEYYHSGEKLQTYTIIGEFPEDTVKTFFKDGNLKELYVLKAGVKNGVNEKYFANGKLSFTMNYVDGKGDGEYISYFVDGTLEDKFTWKEDKIDGKRTRYFDNGQMRSEANYVNDLYEGEVKTYYMNGKVEDISNYKKGKMVGKYETYYSNGQISSSTTLDESGKENGTGTFYDIDGKKYHEFEYSKGEISKVTFFDKTGKATELAAKKGKKLDYIRNYPSGTKSIVGTYIDGVKEGKWENYDYYGNINKIEYYKEGILVDSVLTFYSNGKINKNISVKDGQEDGLYLEYNKFGDLIQEGSYVEGELNGPVYSYFNNGQLDEENYYILGNRHGIQKLYYPNGTINMFSQYEKGLLISRYYLDSAQNILDRFEEYSGEIQLQSLNKDFIRFKGNYVNGYAHGKSTWYGPNNLVICEGGNVLGERHGEWKWYNYNGKLTNVVTYHYGSKNGIEIVYDDEQGNKTREINWEYGKRSGAFKYFHDNGKVSIEGEHFDDERHGRVVQYSERGEVMMIRYYDEGIFYAYSYLGTDGKEVQKISLQGNELNVLSYFKNGKKSVQHIRKNGMIEGEYKEYHENGQMAEAGSFTNNEENGSYVKYYENGVKMNETPYVKGIINGVMIDYYPNGKIKLKTTYLEGDRFGVSEKYSLEGKLIKTIYYFNDDPISIR